MSRRSFGDRKKKDREGREFESQLYNHTLAIIYGRRLSGFGDFQFYERFFQFVPSKDAAHLTRTHKHLTGGETQAQIF